MQMGDNRDRPHNVETDATGYGRPRRKSSLIASCGRTSAAVGNGGVLIAFIQCRYIGWNEPSFLLVVMLLWWYFSWRERRRKFVARQRGAYTP